MTREQALRAAADLRERYFLDGMPNRGDGVSDDHLAYMVVTMHDMSEAKTMRWLGYIQGVLVARGKCSLDDMKEISRAATHSPVSF